MTPLISPRNFFSSTLFAAAIYFSFYDYMAIYLFSSLTALTQILRAKKKKKSSADSADPLTDSVRTSGKKHLLK